MTIRPSGRAIVAGHVCVDLVPELYGDVVLTPGSLQQVGALQLSAGGCVANTGVALADLGANVKLEAIAGRDELGEWLVKLMDSLVPASVSIRLLEEAHTSYSIAIEAPHKDRMFLHHVGANTAFDGRELEVDDADLLHLGYLTLLPKLWERGGTALLDLLARAHGSQVTTSVDFATVDSYSSIPWSVLMPLVLPSVDVASPSADDMMSLFHQQSPQSEAEIEAMADYLLDLGVAVVLVTAGARGMVLRSAGPERLAAGGDLLASLAKPWANVRLYRRAPSVEIKSTVGAGDAATAGLLYGLLHGLSPSETIDLATSSAAHRLSGSRHLPRYEATVNV